MRIFSKHILDVPSYIFCVFAADSVILDDTEVLGLGWGLRSAKSSCYCFSLIPANSHLLVYTDERLEGGGGAQGYQAQPNGHQDDAGDWPPGDHGVTGHGQWSPQSGKQTGAKRERELSASSLHS